MKSELKRLAIQKPCPKCKGRMKLGGAIKQTWGGYPDFPGGAVVTMSPGGPGKLIDCLKCVACGHSETI